MNVGAKTNLITPKCRIVLTCWDVGKKEPYADFVGRYFETFEEAYTAIKTAAKDELETLNERKYGPDEDVEYPSDFDRFRADFDGEEFDAIIRLWDGNNYWPVTGYKIYWIHPQGQGLWRYRSYCEKADNFKEGAEESASSFHLVYLEQNSCYAILFNNEYVYATPIFEDALNFIDEYILKKQKNPQAYKTSKYRLTLCEDEPGEEVVYAYLSPNDVQSIAKDAAGILQSQHLILLTDGRFVEVGIVDKLERIENPFNMKEWNIPVTWEVCGVVKIKAQTLSEAIHYFNENSADIPLPDSCDYVDGSFALTTEFQNDLID